MGNKQAYLFLILASMCPFFPLQADEPVATLKHHPFQEAYQDEVPVSGRVVAGISLTGMALSTAPLALIPPPSAAGNSVCVQVMSRDGRYWSQNTFQLPGGLSSVAVGLEYPSQHQDFLQSLGHQDLAVLGSAGDCSDTDLGTLFLSSTTTRSDQEARVQVFVNSARADTYLAVMNHPELRRPARCRVIEEGRRTGYDTICSLTLSKLGALPEHLDIRIVRRRYERMLPSTEFRLALPVLH